MSAVLKTTKTFWTQTQAIIRDNLIAPRIIDDTASRACRRAHNNAHEYLFDESFFNEMCKNDETTYAMVCQFAYFGRGELLEIPVF